MVVHIASVLLTAFFVYQSAPGSDLFSWHPTCMSVAFTLLLLQAIIIFSPESSLATSSPRQEKLQLHWILHTFGIISALGGFGAVYINKEVNNRKHFTTWHGSVGLAAVCGILIASFGGVLAKYSHNLSNWIRPINLKLYHATGGMLVFLTAMTALALATYSNWFKNRVTSPWVGRLVFWAPFVLALCVARQVTQSYLPRVLKPKESEQELKAKKIQKKINEKLAKKSAKGNRDDANLSEDDKSSNQENDDHHKKE